MFVTVFYGILDIRTGELRYCNAGHNPPLLIREGQTEAEQLPLTGDCILGAIPEAAFHEKGLRLAPGDSLLCYTDGLTEARNEAGDFYGMARLLKCCREEGAGLFPQERIQELGASVAAFAGKAKPSDDITLLSILFRGES
jgi:sigma-B regulation protein RsbU (phosphoserine phosphatase)